MRVAVSLTSVERRHRLGARRRGLRVAGRGVDGRPDPVGGVAQHGQVGGHLVVEDVLAARFGVVDRRGERRDRRPRGVRASSGSTSRDARRCAMPSMVADSSPVATLVTRSTSSCASSTTSRSCSGSTLTSEIASMASSAWLVTTMSAVPALPRAFSAKQSVPYGAAGGADALPGRHADLAPGPVGDAGHHLVAVAGLGVRRPLGEPLARHGPARSSRRRRTAPPAAGRRRLGGEPL